MKNELLRELHKVKYEENDQQIIINNHLRQDEAIDKIEHAREKRDQIK